MSLSSKTLFQFTSSLETLEEILKSKFMWPRYCTEYYWSGYRFALPMMCMCDIPLSEITPHISHYGKYAIGLSKEWASKIKNISTVLYIRRGSSLYLEVCKILRKINKGNKIGEEELFLLSHIKKYSGNTYCNPNGTRKLTKNVCFYNEREWRYIPQNMSPKDIIVEKSQEKTPIKGDNNLTKGDPKYEYEDIRYLIVSEERDRLKLIDFIDNELVADKTTKVVLKSKILTVKQIHDDF